MSKFIHSERFSPFQREKLEYYYRFLVGPQEGNLNAGSMARFNERMLDFTGWPDNSTEAKECREVHNTFYEILLDRVREIEGDMGAECVHLTSWLTIWASMLHGVMGMPHLPIYVRLLPRVLFKIIDRRGEGLLFANDLAIFYRDMVHLDATQAFETAEKAFEQMTDGGRYPLNADGYEQLFANFLIGRTPHGPGRYIFGCFEHEVRPFQLIQPLPVADTDDDVQPIKRTYNRRPSLRL